jgi:MoxR-like ATPase
VLLYNGELSDAFDGNKASDYSLLHNQGRHDIIWKSFDWEKKPKIICIDELDKMPKQFQDKLLNFMESGHIKVDQMRKQYDFKIKGAKVFAACNEITRLSRPLQSRFRCFYL